MQLMLDKSPIPPKRQHQHNQPGFNTVNFISVIKDTAIKLEAVLFAINYMVILSFTKRCPILINVTCWNDNIITNTWYLKKKLHNTLMRISFSCKVCKDNKILLRNQSVWNKNYMYQ